MCKIFAMTNLTKVKVTEKLIGVLRDAVCKTADRDGFGYAVNTHDGKLWGERALNPFQFEPFKASPKGKTAELSIVDVQSNSFGDVKSEDCASLIAHGRMSTNDVSLRNTHPFVNDDIALIHNGVVSDVHDLVTRDLKTTCDTEILLKLWEIGGIETIEDNAGGYYALAILDKQGQLHIVRDDRASLFVAYSPTVDSFLIATTIDILNHVSKTMCWEIETPQSIQEGIYAVFRGNEIVFQKEIFPLGYSSGIDNSKASLALGIDDDSPIDDDYDDIDPEDLVDLMARRRMS